MNRRPVTDAERVAVTEHYFVRTYRFTVLSAIVVSALSVLVAGVDEGSVPWATACVCAGFAAALATVSGERGYRLLRRRPYLPCLPALVALVTASLWTAVDGNALSFAAAASMAVAIAVAQGPRQLYPILALSALAVAGASVAGRNTTPPHTPATFASVAIAGFLTGAFIKFAIHWYGLIVLSEVEAPGADAAALIPPPPDEPPALPVVPRGRAPLSALVLDAAHELALWMRAVRDLITSASARRDAWYNATGFHARELQVLLLLQHHPDEDVARYLGISTKTVRNTAARALRRERSQLDDASRDQVSRETLSAELASTYPTAEAIERVAGEIDPLDGNPAGVTS